MEDRETARMRKYGESKTIRIMMATVPHVTSDLGLRKFQADGFLLTRVYKRSAERGRQGLCNFVLTKQSSLHTMGMSASFIFSAFLCFLSSRFSHSIIIHQRRYWCIYRI